MRGTVRTAPCKAVDVRSAERWIRTGRDCESARRVTVDLCVCVQWACAAGDHGPARGARWICATRSRVLSGGGSCAAGDHGSERGATRICAARENGAAEETTWICAARDHGPAGDATVNLGSAQPRGRCSALNPAVGAARNSGIHAGRARGSALVRLKAEGGEAEVAARRRVVRARGARMVRRKGTLDSVERKRRFGRPA